MNVLENFWYGNLDPAEYDANPSKEYKELVRLIGRNEEKLLATMTEEQADLAVSGSGRCATVAEDINVRKGNMHCHGAELATVGIVVEGISDLMTPVAATLAEPVNRGYLDFGLTHRTRLKM